MIMISSNFIYNFTNFYVIVSFLTKLLTLGILLSTALTALVVAKLASTRCFVFNLIYFSNGSSISS